MKRINNIFLVAAAAALALVSCTKETTSNNEKNVDRNASVRTITVAFANPDTRTSPTNVTGGIQPVWAGGETLTLKCGDQTEDVVVPSSAANNTSFKFTTKLQGTIEVYYPGGTSDYDKYWDASGNVKIPASQSGDFATANLCKGTVAEDGTNLTLTNQTALFQVTPPSEVKQFTVTSLKTIVNGQRTEGTAAPIAADNATVINVGSSGSTLTTFYVALAEGVNLSDLSFEYKTDGTHGAMKGIPMKDIPEGKNTVEAGNAYTITSQFWHEYVTVAGKKWATMNVGATSETDKGLYFAWGDVIGQNATTNDTGAFSTEFSWYKCPFVSSYFYNDDPRGNGEETFSFSQYYNGAKGDYYTIYYECNKDDKTTLDLEDDAAFANWGGAWRMPTSEEFNTLAGAKQSWDGSKKGWTFGNPSIFLPAAGYGYGAGLNDTGYGFYWSSSLDADDPRRAYRLRFYDGEVSTFSGNRCNGYSVRPLSE